MLASKDECNMIYAKNYSIYYIGPDFNYIWALFPLNLYAVSHFSCTPLFQAPRFFTKILESNILYNRLLIDIVSVW